MIRLGGLPIWVGSKEEYTQAIDKGMQIVCALNKAPNQFMSHKKALGYQTQNCPKDHPNYLYLKTDEAIYLNLIDGDSPSFIHHEMINKTLTFIKQSLAANKEVFIFCSLGESRSPSIALMYMLENGLIERSKRTFTIFRNTFYPWYNPRAGVYHYIRRRWGV